LIRRQSGRNKPSALRLASMRVVLFELRCCNFAGGSPAALREKTGGINGPD